MFVDYIVRKGPSTESKLIETLQRNKEANEDLERRKYP
jgi:hypothetical protein